MSETSRSRSKELFLDALEVPSDERETFIDRACGGDATLKARVQNLIAAHERSAALEQLAGAQGDPAPDTEGGTELPLALVSDYELLEELGRGAAGTVYRARQTSLGREVALKVLRAGSLASDSDVRRFRREAEAAAALDHPGIVPVFDTGEVDGLHFFSMKLVEGVSLAQAVDRFAGDPRKAARLVAIVARAVHHAHCRGVLHRDLKPSNILLDTDGQPHVADFGIAQPVDAGRITQTGLICGTPAYMSPEQARGSADVTVATDVWSLGCVLHELVAGEPPFAGGNVAQVLRRVLEQDPPRPPGADRDLATVIAACLAKDPARRYPSALALAEDLDHWLQHLPIVARPATRLERLRLLYRRSPVTTSLGIAVALLLLVLGVGAGVASLVLQRRLQETQNANERANQRLRAALVATARAERRSDRAGRRAAGLELLMQAAAIVPGPDVRDEAITTLTLPDLVTIGSWSLAPELDLPIAVDDDVEQIAVCSPQGRVEVRAAADGRMRAEIPGPGGRAQGSLFSRDGHRLWLRRHGPTGTPQLEVWDLAVVPPTRLHRRVVAGTAFARSRDGATFALARADAIELVDAETFAVQRELPLGERVNHCAFRPDGGALAVATATANTVEVMSLPDGGTLHSLELRDTVRCVDWSPDGSLLIAGCYDQRAYVWDTSTWEMNAVLRGHEAEVIRVAMLPRRLAVTHAWDGTTRVWDVETEEELFRSTSFLFAQDRSGHRALLRGDGSIEVAEFVVDDVLRVLHAHQGKAPREIAESPDGRLLATCGEASWQLWDARSCTRVAIVPCGFLHSIAFDPRGGGIVTCGVDGLLRWPLTAGATDAATPEVGKPEVLLEGPFLRGGVSPDGRLLAAVSRRAAFLLDRDGHARELGRHAGLDRVAFSPDGEWIAVGSWGGQGVRVWNTGSGRRVAHLLPDASSAMATFSPDGTRLVVAHDDAVLVLQQGSWEVLREFPRHRPRRPGVPAAFSPDGALMAIGIAQSRVRLVHVDGWRTLADLEPANPRNLFHLSFLDGGRRLAVTTPSRRVLIWNLERIRAELDQRGLIDRGALPWRKTR